MKLNKILAVALAALTMTACSNDDDFADLLGSVNTASGVSVSVLPTFSAGENESPIYIPIEVTGETNGKVVVTVEVKEGQAGADTEAAKEVDHYNVTSKTINIPAGESIGYIEVMPVWEQGVINDDRVFEVSIVSVNGATVGSQAICEVTIVNVDDAYTMMLGSWTFSAEAYSGGQWVPTEMVLTFKAPAADSEYYGDELYGWGLGNADYFLPFYGFQYDEVAGQGTINLGIGSMMSEAVFNYGLEDYAFPVCLSLTDAGSNMSDVFVCTFDGEMNEIVIPQDAAINMGLFFYTSMQYSGYTVGRYRNMKLTR